MLFRLSEIVLLPIAWAALVLGSLQSKLLVSASAHTVCGPWGCGPETPALVAIHSGWLAFISPPLIFFPLRLKWPSAAIRRLSYGLFAIGLVGVLAIVAWQWLVWLPQARSRFKKLYLATMRIRRHHCRRLAIDTTVNSLGNSVGHFVPPA